MSTNGAMDNDRYTILTRRESRSITGRSRKVRQHQHQSTARETALPTDLSSDDEDDEMDEDEDEESSCEEEEASAEEERGRLVDQKASSSRTNSNSMLETPDKISVPAGPDAPAWESFLAGASGHAWDSTITSGENADFNGTLPELPVVSSDVLQGLGVNGSEAANYGFCPDLLDPSLTDMSGSLRLEDLEMAGVEPHQQPAMVPVQGTAVARSSFQGRKVVLSIEEADHTTVDSLLQTAFSSGSRFHFARE